ncbi:hypothetical protein DTO207G8_6591 [Paecilomyces variotii]|nr:hypothetical protein DTO207G8_6591 [Paecilomyces variotii]KAJ9382390.1 hypothetical protein DTO063F5_5774 [Paecilomyces variotii]KAJ9409585.1 hypothetical protein DTO045G8_2511 [Paecilomyces variotii]
MAGPEQQEIEKALSTGNFKEISWYEPELETVTEPARTLLEKYSGIPADKITEHVKKVRDRAFAIFPYPCIGMFRFLDLSIPTSPYYNEVIERLRAGEIFLDLGCCFGQELRQLAFDGAPSENLYGSDLRLDFMELGYDLFLDKDKLKSRFIASDIFDPASALLKELSGKVDIIHTGSFFHLFDWDQQVAIAKQAVSILRHRPGSLIVGRQVGHVEAKEDPRRSGAGLRYKHNPESWQKLWDQVGSETGSKWKVEAYAEPFNHGMRLVHDEGTIRLRFAVRRL